MAEATRRKRARPTSVGTRRSTRLQDTLSKSHTHSFAQTPKVRNLYLDTSVDDVSDAEIAFTSWKTYRVMPLLNFSYERQNLRKYAKNLGSYIEMEQKKNNAVLINNEQAYKVSLLPLDGLAITPEDGKGIKIQILSNNSKEEQKLLFVGILASVERCKEPWEETNFSRFTVLPLFLARGNQIFLKAVMKFLQEQFGSSVRPLTFSHVQMTWMLAMWAGSGGEDGVKPLLMEYSLPFGTLHTIQYSIDGKGCYKMWKSVHDPDSNYMDEDEVKEFLKCLDRHFMTMFSIDLSSFHLQSIGTAAAAVHRNGVVKILKNDSIHYVLRHLTNLSQEFIVT